MEGSESPPVRVEVESAISCVAFFYEEGKGGENFRAKNKFRCMVNHNETSVVKLRRTICERSGIKETAKKLGLGNNVLVELNRESRKGGRTERFSIVTDHHLKLEFPSILNGEDKLQLIVYPVKTVFSENCPTIVIKDSSQKARRPAPVTSLAGELTDEEQKQLNEELAKRGLSKLVKCKNHTDIKTRTSKEKNAKVVQWPWKIACGNCKNNLQLRYDSDLKGRISHFDRHHYSRCSENKPDKEAGTSKRKITDFFSESASKKQQPPKRARNEKKQPPKKARNEKKQPPKKARNEKTVTEVDSDLDLSDVETPHTDFSSGEGEYDTGESDADSNSYDADTDSEADSVDMCSCSGLSDVSDDGVDEDDLFTVYVGVEEADPLCIKIQDLLRRGKISKDKIFYKYINDVLEIMYNPFHEYDQEVIEFFNTITYLGGKRTACFIRGPMNLGDGRRSHMTLAEKKMNLGGPSESVCSKYQAGYTPESGVIKPLSLGHMALLKNSKAKPLIDSEKLSVIPCVLANDGTALKPAIEFDPRLKENIGLKTPVDLNYVKANPSPSPDHLKENIITEAIVTSLTSLDNFCSLPVAVDYTTQTGKTGEAMTEFFEGHIKTLQACECCQQEATDRRHIITSEDANCNSFCEECFDAKKVCDDCALSGQVSYMPSLRICKRCEEKNLKCFRRVVMVLCSDCESGNKNAFEALKEKLEAGTDVPYLTLLSILPDCPHVGKSMKAAFSNWWLKCREERINLGLLRTLRNRCDLETKETFRKLIPKNDHVKNKDRQDPSSVSTLSSTKLTNELKSVGYVCHTIIPELDKYSADNQVGMFPSPISVGIPSYGWIAFLSYDVKTSSSTLYKARLHSPVDKISEMKKNLTARDLHCTDGMILLTSDGGPIKVIEFDAGAIDIVSKAKRKEELINLAQHLGVSEAGTVPTIKERLKKHIASLKSKYPERDMHVDEVNFWNNEDKPSFEAITCIDEKLVYGARKDTQSIISFQLEKDGVGIRGENMTSIFEYASSWHQVFSICTSVNSIFISHCNGISRVSLDQLQCCDLIQLDNEPCMLAALKTEILFTNQKKASVWKMSAVGDGSDAVVFAGCENVEGSLDGKVRDCRFRQPIGICTESQSIVYICDAQTNSVKICTKMEECASFLRSIGQLFDAFSVHRRGEKYTVKSLSDAVSLVEQTNQFLQNGTDNIRATTGISCTINGPQGYVSARTVASVGLLEWGLKRLQQNLAPFSYNATNLLSCMTLDVENCHSTVHSKQANLSMAEYARSFGITMKESMKRVTKWAAYYHTSRKSWYPKPDETISFWNVPIIDPLPTVQMSKADCDTLRDWVAAYGAAVRQRTVRQETTMARHGTLPEYMYQRQCITSETSLDITFQTPITNTDEPTVFEAHPNELESNELDADDEYDVSSDESEPEAEEAGGDCADFCGEIGRSTNFLLGTTTRFGRAVRFNNRFLS